MSFRRSIEQLRPARTQKIAIVEQAQNYLRELTISPHYQQKGNFNPYYTLDTSIEKIVKEDLPKKIKYVELLFKSVEKGKGTLLLDAKGKFEFQIVAKTKSAEIETSFYIKVPKKFVKSHYGMKQRKDSTASSNVNEFLTVYFLQHTKFTNAEKFMADVAKLSGGTKIFTGEEQEVSYETLIELLDKDESAIRDINIGYQNSLAVKKDLKKWDKLYWTPRGKPAGIGGKNPSDVIIHIGRGNYVGYSNKIASGKDVTPKINTNVKAFFEKLGSSREVKEVLKYLDDSWNEAASTVKGKNAVKALRGFDITREKPSESSSKRAFAMLAKEFQKDKLQFYGKDFYFPYRNNFIKKLGKWLQKPMNMNYFLKTIGYYTYDDVESTPCPYKLLVGSEKGSAIKDVSSNEDMKEFLLNDSPMDLSGIKFNYKDGQQSFNMTLRFKVGNYSVDIPITTRTRTAGGWSGKALYITSPGIKLQQ